jgi:hypothetical protein
MDDTNRLERMLWDMDRRVKQLEENPKQDQQQELNIPKTLKPELPIPLLMAIYVDGVKYESLTIRPPSLNDQAAQKLAVKEAKKRGFDEDDQNLAGMKALLSRISVQPPMEGTEAVGNISLPDFASIQKTMGEEGFFGSIVSI